MQEIQKKIITNTFDGGLNWDDHISIGNNQDYKYAKNIISSDDIQNSFKSNEHSNRMVAEYSKAIVGKRYIAELNSTIVFLEGGEVHIYNHDKEETKLVAKDSEFGCDWGMSGCEYVDIHNHYQYINDLWIVYSSNKTFYNLNLTELLDEKRKAGLITSLSSGCGEGCSQRTCQYFKVFKKSCDPHIEAIVLSGGSLANGTYFIGGRYKNNQGGFSNPFIMTSALHVGGNDNIAGELSNKRIEVSIQNASCSFDQIELFVHEIVNGSTITKAFPVQYITGSHFTIQYTGTEGLIPIDIAELLVNSRTYIEGEDVIFYNNRALYYRTTPEFEYNFQPIANQIQANWFAVKVPMSDMKRYNIKSYLRGETYAFSFSPNYDNSKKGYGFTIPAISGGGGCTPTPYIEPIEQSHTTGKRRPQSSSSNGSDNPASSQNGNFSVFSGGCAGTTQTQVYTDTDNFCTATLLYTDEAKTILAPADSYKIEGESSFIRVWNGTSFDYGCNICVEASGSSSGGGGGASQQLEVSGSSSAGGSVNINITTGLLYKRIRNNIPSTVNNPTQETFKDFAKGIIDSWETNNKDVRDIIAPACLPGGCDNTVIEEIGGTHANSGGGGGGGGGGSTPPTSPTTEKRNEQTNSNLVYYIANSCINTDYSITIATETTGLTGSCIVANSECFSISGIDTNPNANFIFGDSDYNTCNECRAFNGSGTNQSGGGSGGSGGGGGGGCGGGCKTCGGKNCIDGKCYDTDTSTTETLFFDENNNLTGSSKTTGSINSPAKAITDEINSFCNVRDDQKDANIITKDLPKAEELGALWFNALSNYINEQKEPADANHSVSDNTVAGSTPANLLKNPVEAVKTLKQASQDLIAAIENRERFEFEYNPYSINKSLSYSEDSLGKYNNHNQETTPTTDSVVTYDDNGNIITGGTKDIEVQLGIYKKYPIIAKGKTKPKVEKNTYPCITDCYGNQIYCGLGGANVTHHTMPTNADVPFWIPKSSGDGSTYQTDSSIMDGYAVVIGIEFTNINIPDNIKAKLCPTNPYTIGVVKRDSNNSSIILKGLATESYSGQNQGKDYIYFKYGLNSMEKISKYIDSDGLGKRFGGTSDNLTNVHMYSLDQLTRAPFLNGTHYIREGTMMFTGARHGLYAKGRVSKDNRARRKDKSGAIHTAMAHSFSPSNSRGPLQGQIYADANEGITPPTGARTPFMNKHGQSCAWLIGPGIGRGINDDSFVGDVLQDKAPITNGEADYFSVFREMDSQYGDVSNLNYVPILQGRGFSLSVHGLVGDTYIGPYSFVKTGYVSDKVGNYFPIGNMVEGKSDRCLCDDPNDAVHSVTGNWYWKEIPIDGDAADPKRWAGTHTSNTTKTWQQSRMQATESHYYYPAITTHLISYVGESEANPWLREKSDLLENQWYPELKPKYSLHIFDNNGGDHEESYLHILGKIIEQASQVQLALKVLIKSFINIAIPLLGVNDWLSNQTALEAGGDLLTAVMNFSVWLLISQVLMTNDFIDKFLRLDACTRDEEGGEQQDIERFFTNYDSYNNDYSIDYFYPTIKGLPMEYTGCMATNSVTNTIYVSEENDVSHYVNGYQVVRPNSKIMLEESYGKITKMYSISGRLFIHTTDGIYQTQINQLQVPTNMGDLLMGSSSIISKPQLITSSVQEGQHGLEHPNHGKITDKGFLFVDYNAKELLLFTGSNFEVLSDNKYKMNRFFKQHLNFCSQNECMFEQKENTPHYAFGIDNAHDRILFTKSDGEYSYTLSYDLSKGRWSSFHDYMPQEYLNDRNQLYTIHRNKIYKHDVYDKYTTYYDDFYGSRVDFVTTTDQDQSQWLSSEIFTEARQGFNRDRNVTFNKFALLNSWQSTGYINLKVDDNKGQFANDTSLKIIDKTATIDLKRLNSKFRFNEIYDYTVDHNKPVLIYEDCKAEPILVNGGNYNDRSDQHPVDRIVSDNYYYYSFIFDNFADTKLYLKKVDTLISRKPI